MGKTGSVGYNASSHGVIVIDDEHSVGVMISVNAAVKNSKYWDKGEATDSSTEEKGDAKEDTKATANKKKASAKGSPMTKTAFLEKAHDLSVSLLGAEATLKAKKFSTGSMGWACSKQLEHKVGGEALRLSVAFNV